MRFASLYYNKYLCAHYKRFAPAAQLSKHTKRELHEAVPTCETLILLCVGGDAYIAPAKCTCYFENLRRIRWCPWVDVGIDPYGFQARLIQIRQNPERMAFRIFSVSKNLVEFRPAGRNKMEIHFIRWLCQPEKYFSPCKCELFARRAKSLRAVKAHPF